MTSLKTFITILAPTLNMTEGELYSRQRALVEDHVLKKAGRGPGNGLNASTKSVALLLIAALSTPDRAEAPRRTRELAKARSQKGIEFGTALADLLSNPSAAKEVLISQSSVWAEIKGVPSEVFSSGGQKEPGVSVVAIIPRGALRAIAEQLGET